MEYTSVEMNTKVRDIIQKVFDKENADLLLSHQLEIPLRELKQLRQNKKEHQTSIVFGKKIQIADPFWHLHSLKEIFLDNTYKFRSRTANPLILDCGANVGLSAIYFKKLYPASRIMAFEPDPSIFKMLQHNMKVMGYNDVCLHNKGVWKEDAILKFASTGGLGGALTVDASRKYNRQVVTEVAALRLKDFLGEEIEFLKIDIEGAETEVLADCADELTKVQNMFVEYHSTPGKKQELPTLLRVLQQAGFRIYIKEAWENLPHPFLRNDYVPFWDLQLNIFAYRVAASA